MPQPESQGACVAQSEWKNDSSESNGRCLTADAEQRTQFGMKSRLEEQHDHADFGKHRDHGIGRVHEAKGGSAQQILVRKRP